MSGGVEGSWPGESSTDFIDVPKPRERFRGGIVRRQRTQINRIRAARYLTTLASNGGRRSGASNSSTQMSGSIRTCRAMYASTAS